MKDVNTATRDELFEDGEPKTEIVELDGGKKPRKVLVRELSGRERFEFATLGDIGMWDSFLWFCWKGMESPALESKDDAEKLKPEHASKIAKKVMELSGIAEEQKEEAAKK